MPEQLVSERQVAKWLGISPATLLRMRRAGVGPPFVVLSTRRLAYRPHAVEQWIAERETVPAK